MARIRTIKPGFYTDVDLCEASIPARHLAGSLLTQADREGRLWDIPKKIKLDAMPWDDVDVDALLDELARVGFIRRYVVDGKSAIQVVTFAKHQRPHVKEAPSAIPPEPVHAPDSGPEPTKDRASTYPGSGQHAHEWDPENGIQEGEGGSARARMEEPSPTATADVGPSAQETGLSPTALSAETVSAEGAAEEGAQDGSAAAAAPAVVADGWSFEPEAMAQLEAAVEDLGMLPQELPGKVDRTLRKWAADRTKKLPMRVVEAWASMPAGQVAAWCQEAMAKARVKNPDRIAWPPLAAGIIANALELGSDLLLESKGKLIQGPWKEGGTVQNKPAEDFTGWRSLLRGQGSMGADAWVVRIAEHHRRDLGYNVNPTHYLEICLDKGRDVALQALWEHIQREARETAHG